LKNQTNKLYLYIYQNGDFKNLDELPVVDVLDQAGDPVVGAQGLTACTVTKGVYEVTIPNVFTGSPTPCVFYDNWTNLKINGQNIPTVENQFILQAYQAGIQIGSLSQEPKKYGVVVKQEWSASVMLENVDVYYRVYVREGTTEVQVQDWTPVNRTPNEYYFIFDMRDKIPNEYFVDIKVDTSGEKDIYKDTLQFQIVNKK
jgi:hypothetical protein